MKLIVCLDDRNGVLFLGRRLSRDRAVCADILAQCGGGKLWMNAYSAAMFGADARICVAEDFLDKAMTEDSCFVENVTVEPYLPVSKLTVYRWNRCYPSDRKFPLEQALRGMVLQSRCEFAGSSHDVITREEYCG